MVSSASPLYPFLFCYFSAFGPSQHMARQTVPFLTLTHPFAEVLWLNPWTLLLPLFLFCALRSCFPLPLTSNWNFSDKPGLSYLPHFPNRPASPAKPVGLRRHGLSALKWEREWMVLWEVCLLWLNTIVYSLKDLNCFPQLYFYIVSFSIAVYIPCQWWFKKFWFHCLAGLWPNCLPEDRIKSLKQGYNPNANARKWLNPRDRAET